MFLPVRPDAVDPVAWRMMWWSLWGGGNVCTEVDLLGKILWVEIFAGTPKPPDSLTDAHPKCKPMPCLEAERFANRMATDISITSQHLKRIYCSKPSPNSYGPTECSAIGIVTAVPTPLNSAKGNIPPLFLEDEILSRTHPPPPPASSRPSHGCSTFTVPCQEGKGTWATSQTHPPPP